jgi:malonyl CoA-acyl carrier protein transacylase
VTTYLFPGQGSQYDGMGAGLFEAFPAHTEVADRVLGYSIRDLCVTSDPRLNDTRFTQPALFVVNVLEYHALQRCSPCRPSYLLGHSLGEYCALHLAGAFDFEAGLRLVRERGALMATARNGGMAAVLGMQVADVRRALEAIGARELWVANHNAPRQVVVSGGKEAVAGARQAFIDRGASSYVVLNVSGAFHSPLMGDAQREFEKLIATVPIRPPEIRVVANVSGTFHDEASVRGRLVEQISGAVRWVESVELLASRGETRFIEVGKKRTLSRLIDETLGATSSATHDQSSYIR